jgi:iron(III) transport system substrate-binding protein
MRQLHAQVARYADSEAALTEAVGKGEVALAVGWAHDALAAADRGEPVVLPAPPDLLFEVGAVSLVKGGPNPAGARALIEWLVGREAGQLVVSMANRPAVAPGVEPPSGLTPLDGSTLAPYEPAWAAENRARLVAAWRTAVGR